MDYQPNSYGMATPSNRTIEIDQGLRAFMQGVYNRMAGAELMREHGQVYDTDEELISRIRTFDRNDFNIEAAYNHVAGNHLISNTVDDIERVARSAAGSNT